VIFFAILGCDARDKHLVKIYVRELPSRMREL